MTDASKFIAIDGPAGSGKSSVSKEIARREGYGYLDTGAAYRALAWHVLDRGDDTADADAVRAAASDFPFSQGLDPDALLFLLDQRGVHASVGSACRAGVHQPSEVLLAIGRTADEAAQSLRFSLGRTTTAADIERFEEVLPLAVEQARNV